ncbi:MAG: hypothetical protein QF612_01650 [Candidatus Thalassarchaeaceae archaeon]|nr:hypothetical protein [Candidatus Thalassarchaeaceae archaeon]
MRNKTLLVFTILLLHCIAPLATYSSDGLTSDNPESNTARAANSDTAVTQIEWIGPSYYCNSCAMDILTPGAQNVRITIENQGLLQGVGAVTVYIDSGDGLGLLSIGSQSISLSPGGVAQYVFSFTASVGTGQQIRAYAAMVSDIDLSNNQLDQNFEVAEENAGEVYSDTLPPGGTRLAQVNTVVSVGVRNAGNLDTEATPVIILTPVGAGDTATFEGDPVTLSAGSVAFPPSVDLASLIINATTLSGDYTLSGDVYFNSTSPILSDVVSITPRIITFSQYRTTLIAPSDRAVEPGDSTTLTFMVQNIGDAPDRYNISVTDVRGWADTLNVPSQTPIVNASSSTVIVVSVTVPFGTNRSYSDLITVEIESEGGEYTLSDSTAVMAGDLLLGELNHSSWLVPIIPGTEAIIQYTLRNNGTSPAIFNLQAGFSQTAPGWTVEIHPATTPYLTVGEEIIVNVVVQPPSLSLPFDPTTKLAEGNQLTLWTSVTPEGGGPNVQQTTLEVQKTIMVELIADQTVFPVDSSELLTGPVSRFIDIEMELRHNLVSGFATTVDIQLLTAPATFTPSVPPNGPNEIFRWNSSVTPNQTSMDLGETESLVASILGPSDMHPLAGSLAFDVVANLTLSGALTGIQAPESNISIVLEIPELTLADVTTPPPTTVTPEILSTTPVNISNTGNHEANFTLSVEGPDGWIVSIAPTSILGLHSTVDAWPLIGGDNITTSLSVTAPQNTRADTPFEVNVTVWSDSGEELVVAPIPFLVQEVIGASLSPEYAVAVIPVNGNASIALEANNTGNSLQTFTVSIEETLDDINLTMISDTEIDIEPGELSIVQIEVTSEQFARADQNHSAQVVLYHNGVELDRIDVYVEMIANHQIEFEHASVYSVIPGMNLSIPVNVTNVGNLEEFINLTATPPAGWQASVTPLNMTIDGEGVEVLPLIIDVTVPPMSHDAGLEPGTIHNLIVLATNVSDSVNVGLSTIQFNVEPIFVLSSDDFPDIVDLLPGELRTFDIEISNDGNQDVVLDLDCEVDNPGRWDVPDCDATNLTLASGEARSVSFSVEGVASDHYNLELSALRLTFSPQDNHSGDALLATVLRISRMHVDAPFDLSGGQDSHEIDLDWMHVQAVGQTADSRAIAYELEMVNEERYINKSLYSGDINWSFEINYGNGFVPLFNGNTYTLNPESPLQLNSMTIRAVLPSAIDIPPGDGWTLKFNLTHPEEIFTTQITVDLRVDAWADPTVISIRVDGQSNFIESKSGTLVAEITNAGNAGTALGIDATLECESGIIIQDEAIQEINSMEPFETRYLEWEIQSNALNWWVSSDTVPCTVEIEAPLMEGDDESNDIKSVSIDIQSWSLPLLILTPITLLLVTLSTRLLRRASEDERSLMLCAYSGTALLGLATQYNLGLYVNFSLAATALLWVAFIASRSSAFEIPAILSDRQNLQRGSDSIFEDHEAEMERVIKQLTTKLIFAPLGFIIVAIAMPNDISWSLANIGSILLFSIAGGLLVVIMTLRTRNIWLTIFNQLAAMEIESQELLTQLGNPSADLRRITIGQRWGEAHDVSVEVDSNV